MICIGIKGMKITGKQTTLCLQQMIEINKNLLTGTENTLPWCIPAFFHHLPSSNYHHLSHKQQIWAGRGIIRGCFVILNYLPRVCVNKHRLKHSKEFASKKSHLYCHCPQFHGQTSNTAQLCVSTAPSLRNPH